MCWFYNQNFLAPPIIITSYIYKCGLVKFNIVNTINPQITPLGAYLFYILGLGLIQGEESFEGGL